MRSDPAQVHPQSLEHRRGPLPKRSVLSDGTYEAIKSRIMDHEIPPGTRVSIDGLARVLEVSQTPVREALARLEADGLVTKEPLKGYSATRLLTPKEFDDLFELRQLIEPWAAASVAQNVDDSGILALEAELATCKEAPAGSSYAIYKDLTDHDARFHGLILQLSGNKAVESAFIKTHCHLHLFRLYYAVQTGTRAIHEHADIVAAIRSRNPESARRAMSDHIELSRQRLLPAVISMESL
jgi:DNA-binding GntR family transcriptional regulator